MIKEFKLPDIGEGLVDAEIIKWQVAVGDTVEVNQNIVEVETAKAVVELPCPYEGVVTGLMVSEGETVEVGTPIIAVDTAQEDGADEGAGAGAGTKAEGKPPAAPAEESTERPLVGYGVKIGATKRRPRKGTPAAVSEAPAPAAEAPAAPAETRGRVAVPAKPPVRKLAKDLGVDLTTISGSGPQGSITRDDVHAAARTGRTAPASAQAVPAAAGAPGERERRIPVKGVRKHTAAAMVRSAFTAPHVTEWLQVDVTATMDAIRRLRELPDFADVRLSPLLLAARALLLAVRRYPEINSSWEEESQEIVVKHYVNLGIAAATDRGLIVPNVKEAQSLSLPDLARALASLIATAREGKTPPADMAGTTITITNVGVFGVDAGTPILNPGEAAILAVGQIRDLPWVVDGEIVPRKVCTLALSFDHRIVDGELGSNVLRDLGAMLEDPLRMLAWS